jgi:hypothetical protein
VESDFTNTPGRLECAAFTIDSACCQERPLHFQITSPRLENPALGPTTISLVSVNGAPE